ncbi:unnamed protein product [Didymodactylos carnosus]|uniref:Carbohydrate kinase FGGY N-terminal domain-containing protein n=1 Tax=Didymodactylos carnosus TaxID=1234261 RepID=A0A814FLN4_9BILA|nr:unnamed protein product [Didymodactylos carnosus]CAF1479562.1 unnamed protein product [Didymodactylos carnosus]CAF3755433.1 unnamed protein product [Didymodactylos carnosus]CAF4270242.1 unnamed protein product [Didymodactylos carnosus]
MSYLGIDIGTTSCKLCLINNVNNEKLAEKSLVHNAHVDQPSHPEYDEQSPLVIVESIKQLLDSVKGHPVQSIQLCGQMHGILFWHSNDSLKIVSNLITWQDQRCSKEFLDSLSSKTKMSAGYGLATYSWLKQNKSESIKKYDRCGTIMDYIAELSCYSQNTSFISTQNANSWGYYDIKTNTWEENGLFDYLPNIVQPGTIIGHTSSKSCFSSYLPENIPVFVSLGDLQCSVYSCLENDKNDCVCNISTSAQLCVTIERKHEMNKNFKEDQLLSSYIRVPYFDNNDLLVAASLNGGNVLTSFIQMIDMWLNELIPNSSSFLSIQELWSKIIQLGLKSSSCPLLDLSAALYGERHDPDMCAYIQNIRFNTNINNIGLVFRSICHWIIQNLYTMITKQILVETNTQRIICTGNALIKNQLLQNELKLIFSDMNVIFNHNSDAAYGAALFCLHHQSKK